MYQVEKLVGLNCLVVACGRVSIQRIIHLEFVGESPKELFLLL